MIKNYIGGMMQTRELRECPFCGGLSIIIDEKGSEIFDCKDYIAICRDCKTNTRKHLSYDDASKAWNTRITDPRPETIKDFKPMSNAEESAWREE